MSETSIKKNFIYQVAYQILVMLIPIVTAPYISRVLGADGVGVYSYTYSIASYFVLAAKLGIHVYGNRSIAAVRDNKEKLNQTFSDLLAIHVIFSLLVMVVYIVYIAMCPEKYKLIVTVQALYIIAEMFEINWLFFGLEKFKITVIRNSLVKIVSLIAIFIFVKNADDVWKYCAIMAVGTAISETIVWMFLPRYVKIVKPDMRVALSHFKPLVAFFIPSIAVSLYKVMDKIMLGAMSGTIQVGYFENSEKIIIMTLGLVNALGTVMMPRMTNLAAKGDIAQVEKMINSSMKAILIITIAMAFGIAGVAPVFAPVFFGEEFTSSYTLLIGLAVSMPFTAFANVLRTQFLIPYKYDFAFQGSVISGAIVNIILNSILIGRLGAMGAVIGTVVAEVTVCIIQAISVRKKLPVTKYIAEAIPYFLFGSVMWGGVWIVGSLMENTIITLVIQIIIGAIIYGIFTAGYLYYKKDNFWLLIEDSVRKIRKKIKVKELIGGKIYYRGFPWKIK